MTKKNIVNLLVPKLLKIRISEPTYERLSKSKKWGANYKIGETCSKGQLPMILHRIIKNLRWFFDKYLVQLSLLHTMGQERETHCSGGFTQTVWGPYFNIQRRHAQWGMGQSISRGGGGGEVTKLGYIGWGIHFPHPSNPSPQRPSHPSYFGKTCILDILGNFSINHVYQSFFVQ